MPSCGEWRAVTDSSEVGDHVELLSRFKLFLLGQPLSNSALGEQRLSNPVALAVFASDALASVAYATQEILLMLVVAGTAALTKQWPIALGIGALIVIVTVSYRQTIKAYPQGGGSYSVAKANLGPTVGLVAGSALLIDYVLDVAVSVAAGTAALTSAVPSLYPYRVIICLAIITLLGTTNLRGARQSGALFAIPTYAFVVTLGGTLLWGFYRLATVGPAAIRVPSSHEAVAVVSGLTLFVIAKAFASGCTAMTGIECIANGTAAFKDPTAANARKTMLWMSGILLFLFLGLSYLVLASGMHPSATETVISQLSRHLLGGGWPYYVVSLSTVGILLVAANTAYADFPRLSSFMANDSYLPHQFAERGQRLVFSNGIAVLSTVAALLVIAFRGEVAALIPLFAVGVFLAFTVSQAGMVVHWYKGREPGWHRSIVVNGVGSVVCGLVTVVVASAKFTSGAWMVVLVIPAMVLLLLYVKRRYEVARAAGAFAPGELEREVEEVLPDNHVVVLVTRLDRRTASALRFARLLRATDQVALYVDTHGDGEELARQWAEAGLDVPLEVVPSPYREIIGPIVAFVRSRKVSPDDTVTVVSADVDSHDKVDLLLHAETPFWIRSALATEPGVAYLDAPWCIES